jgi:hypothetical protein
VRQHLNVDSGLIHLLEPQTAKVIKPFIGLVTAAGFRAGEVLGQFRVPIVLFDGNDRTIRLLEHDASPATLLRPVS